MIALWALHVRRKEVQASYCVAVCHHPTYFIHPYLCSDRVVISQSDCLLGNILVCVPIRIALLNLHREDRHERCPNSKHLCAQWTHSCRCYVPHWELYVPQTYHFQIWAFRINWSSVIMTVKPVSLQTGSVCMESNVRQKFSHGKWSFETWGWVGGRGRSKQVSLYLPLHCAVCKWRLSTTEFWS